MKKLLLLLTVFCANALLSMEASKPQKPSVTNLCADVLMNEAANTSKPDYTALLLKQIKKLIILTLTQSNTIEEAVNTIRSLAEINKEFNKITNDPITIRTIIRLLAQKFNASSEYIAIKLNTLGAKQYMMLYLRLRAALYQKNFALAEILINNANVDIDYQVTDVYPISCAPTSIISLLKALHAAYLAQEIYLGIS